LSPNTGACYVGGVLLLLKHPVVAQQFVGPEQQQQVLQQLETARAQFNAATNEVSRARTAARSELAAAAPATSAAVPRKSGRSGPYRLQQLCDDLTNSASPEAQQQLQLVTAWAQAICKGAGTYSNPLAPTWLGRDPKLMLVQVCHQGVSGAGTAVALALQHVCDEPSSLGVCSYCCSDSNIAQQVKTEANWRDPMALQCKGVH
jgi:hypothetical protein